MNIKGFTLLEVTLFLAISGALGLIAFLGLGPRLRNVRFTQSVRLVENTINSQFNASTSGQNVRPENFLCSDGPSNTLKITAITGSGNPTGSSANCVNNGKMVLFEADKMTFYSIVSRRSSTPVGGVDCSSTSVLSQLEECYAPLLTGVNGGGPPDPQVQTYSSGVTATFPTAPATSHRGYGYIQSPNGVEQYPFFFTGNVTSSPHLRNTNTVSTGDPLKVCFELSGRQAQLTVENNAVKPKISFEGCTL